MSHTLTQDPITFSLMMLFRCTEELKLTLLFTPVHPMASYAISMTPLM